MMPDKPLDIGDQDQLIRPTDKRRREFHSRRSALEQAYIDASTHPSMKERTRAAVDFLHSGIMYLPPKKEDGTDDETVKTFIKDVYTTINEVMSPSPLGFYASRKDLTTEITMLGSSARRGRSVVHDSSLPLVMPHMEEEAFQYRWTRLNRYVQELAAVLEKLHVLRSEDLEIGHAGMAKVDSMVEDLLKKATDRPRRRYPGSEEETAMDDAIEEPTEEEEDTDAEEQAEEDDEEDKEVEEEGHEGTGPSDKES